jgi:hypothetical protein
MYKVYYISTSEEVFFISKPTLKDLKKYFRDSTDEETDFQNEFEITRIKLVNNKKKKNYVI